MEIEKTPPLACVIVGEGAREHLPCPKMRIPVPLTELCRKTKDKESDNRVLSVLKSWKIRDYWPRFLGGAKHIGAS